MMLYQSPLSQLLVWPHPYPLHISISTSYLIHPYLQFLAWSSVHHSRWSHSDPCVLYILKSLHLSSWFPSMSSTPVHSEFAISISSCMLTTIPIPCINPPFKPPTLAPTPILPLILQSSLHATSFILNLVFLEWWHTVTQSSLNLLSVQQIPLHRAISTRPWTQPAKCTNPLNSISFKVCKTSPILILLLPWKW